MVKADNVVSSGLKKIFATVFTQCVILVMSLITGIILPKYMGAEMFGFWQVYVFYIGFLNLFGLGYNDGIALFYGGYEFSKLPLDRLRSSTRLFIGYTLVLAAFLFIASTFAASPEMRLIYRTLSISIPSICIMCVILTTFLITNRTAIYNWTNLLTKLLSTILFIGLLIIGITDFQPMLYADYGVRIVITIICLVVGRKLLVGKGAGIKAGVLELKKCCLAGINITGAVIAGSFIPVVGRVVIEWNEPIAIYGMYAFAMSLINIILVFTNTAGTVVFPILKKIDEKVMSTYYTKLVSAFSLIVLFAFYSYIPVFIIIKDYMPEYIPILKYLNILLAMCLPLGKMQLLLTPYYKAFRKEKQFLLSNLLGMGAMVVLTFLTYFITHSITVVAVCTTVVIIIWTILSECYILKCMNIKSGFNNIRELLIMLVFIYSTSTTNLLYFSIVYSSFTLIYIFISRKEIREIIGKLINRR